MAVEDRRHPEAERLAEYADGVLDAASRAEVDQHLADCADCRAVVMETMAFLDSNLAIPASEARKVVPFRPRPWVRGVTVGLAAAAALLLAIRVARPVRTARRPSRTAGTDRGGRQRTHEAGRGAAERWLQIRAAAVADARRWRSRSIAGRPDCGGQDRKGGW
jgi:anti-sigma factor RsiW